MKKVKDISKLNIDYRLGCALLDLFRRYGDIEKVALFGSRARKDNTEKSDYDLAVYGHLSWHSKSELRYACEEDLPTLHKIDLIFMEEQDSRSLIENIENDGVVIYEKAVY